MESQRDAFGDLPNGQKAQGYQDDGTGGFQLCQIQPRGYRGRAGHAVRPDRRAALYGHRRPTVLGIKPIPNINEKIKEMLDKYRKETIDIEDIEFEEADLEEDELFGDGSAK